MRVRFVSLGLLLIGCWTVQGQTQSDKQRSIDEVFLKFHEYALFQGAVLVADRGEIIYQRAFGQANREWNVDNTVDTRFNIASLSKQFTAALILQLVDEGQIHLDSTIASYYPEYRSDVGQRVTIHQLLTHQSGIPNYTSLPYVWSDSLSLRYTAADLIRKFGSQAPEFTPGSRFQYSNTGYLLLSIIAERVSGQPYDSLLAERIFQPAQLTHTGVDDQSRLINKRAYGYERTTKGFYPTTPMHMANLQGAGNLYSTVEDLYRWDQALYESDILPKKWRKVMVEPHTEGRTDWIPPYENTYGYGVGLSQISLTKKRSVPMIFHSGHIRGFSSFYARFPEDQQTVIILSNTGKVSTAKMNELTQEILKILYELPYQLPERDLAGDLYQVIQQEGIAAAVTHFHYLRDAFPYEFQDASYDLDALGQQLNQEGDSENALIIFQLNSDVHPHWSTFYRLAAACLAVGEVENATRFFERSQSLNPRRNSSEKEAFRDTKETLKSLRKQTRAESVNR